MPKRNRGLERTKPSSDDLDKLTSAIAGVATSLSGAHLSPQSATRTRRKLEDLTRKLVTTSEALDPVRRPASSFDPSNPAYVARFIALTMAAQERVPLSSVGKSKFYGSGVYAIYYCGDFPAYRSISRKEHPIYVGKADPAKDKALSAIDQGKRLWSRLNDHRKSVSKSRNLDLSDFEYRFLVVASGWQKAAEDYLIGLFRPIWNKEVKLAFGIGKHGDSAETRKNGRSPWDTLHSGRGWAGSTKVADQKSRPRIRKELREHFRINKPYKSMQKIVSHLVSEMKQRSSADA